MLWSLGRLFGIVSSPMKIECGVSAQQHKCEAASLLFVNGRFFVLLIVWNLWFVIKSSKHPPFGIVKKKCTRMLRMMPSKKCIVFLFSLSTFLYLLVLK